MNGLTPRHHPEAPEEAMAGGASRFLTAEDAGRLTQFYLGFDFEARHDRFGAEVSDHAIIDYCDAIEWRRSVLIARASAVVLEAALEIHPLSQQWDCAELIAACPSRGDRGDSLARLLQIAAFAAGQRGCRTFLVPSNDMLREILPLLQDIGRVRIATTHASVDLGVSKDGCTRMVRDARKGALLTMTGNSGGAYPVSVRCDRFPAMMAGGLVACSFA